MTDLLALARARLGVRASLLFKAEKRHRVEDQSVAVRLSLCAEPNRGPVTRVTGAGPTIEAAIEAAVGKMERRQQEGKAA